MAFDEKKFGAIFPTRNGGTIGSSLENRMLNNVGGAGTTRTKITTGPDGATTMLRTRGGFPEFTTSTVSSSTWVVERGFVARIPSSAIGALFSPYTLRVINARFKPVGTTYTVMPFATPYNVPAADTTKWNDTVTFSEGKPLVNGKSLAQLSISAPLSYVAIPFVIPDMGASGANKYGASNTDRLFAVGDYAVHSWRDGVADAVLGGVTARTDKKALVCGVGINPATNTAKMSQLWFSGDSWRSLSSVWFVTSAQVSMLLTAPYLQKVGGSMVSEQVPPPLVFVGGVAGKEVEGVMLSGGQVCIIGEAELGAHYGESQFTEYQQLILPWTEIMTADFEGERRFATNTSTLIGDMSETYSVSSGEVCDEITVSAESFSKTVGRNETVHWLEKSVDLPPVQASSYSMTGTYSPKEGIVYWSTPPGNVIPRGASAFATSGGALGKLAVSREHESSGSFHVTVSDHDLVSGDYSRSVLTGEQVNPYPGAKYDSTLANPYGNIGSGGGLGLFSLFSVNATCYSGDLSGRAAAINSKAATYVGGKVYDTYLANSQQLFYGSVGPLAEKDDSLLNWTTTDYILYDEWNATFVAVVATFVGEQHLGSNATATLSVKVKITSPSGDSTLDLFTSSFGYGEMLPELTDSNNMVFIPSPRISVMFTPMFREQGMFPGAAYTTAAEVAAGAVQACLFNFVLKLGTFGDIGEDQSNGVVRFIPCNLLEMLYAYVFSTSYGRDEYDRYPVTFLSRFNNINNTLFSQQWRVHYRDGVLTDWLDTLGGAYITETSTELSRI